ncbi:ABC transporter G family member 5 [Striga hermonthica]|uniref:ABC transporter G family member 5 n=1 Tax=Striga hermonthica TaxID=68872 RepID=A0A9N7NW45_STRHE|nr:ABC transporter G family member 5 [Striga hermonthica]
MKKQGCEIEAIGINYTIYQHKKGPILSSQKTRPAARQVLNDVSLTAKPWEILAIVGPSGAGKSSLLEILAGKIRPQSARIYVNGQPVDKARFKKLSGYVTQRDTLFPLLTVEETLRFSARLRLGLSEPELTSRVKSLMQELGLCHVAATRVGDDRARGISGGERRRVSIGVEVIHEPEVLILDEPTSGLDSCSALQILDLLKAMAETRGRTVILSIHQPGFRIVKLFGSILLLANGAVVHHGSTDLLSVNLTLMGLQLPVHVNVVEFAIESIEAIQSRKMASARETARKASEDGPSKTGRSTLQQLFQQSKVVDEGHLGPGLDFHHGFANSRARETAVLTHRFGKNIYRTRELFACRSVSMLVSGLALGSIFYNLEDNLLGAAERVGLFAFILTFLLSSTTEALPIFLQEREILMRETSSGSYRVSSYAIANGLVYLPFLLFQAILFSVPVYWLVGLNRDFMAFARFLVLIWLILYTANSVVVCFSALVPNFIVGNSVISAVMGSFFLFSGYFISNHGIPSYWKFMHYISLFKYPFEGLLVNEFSDSSKCLDYMFGTCVVRGEDVLREEGYGGKESGWRNYVIIASFILFYRFISYVILRYKCSQSGMKGFFI